MKKRKRVQVEEYIEYCDGSETVIERWSSVSECSLDLGIERAAVRKRLDGTRGLICSMGTIRYRRVKEADNNENAG